MDKNRFLKTIGILSAIFGTFNGLFIIAKFLQRNLYLAIGFFILLFIMGVVVYIVYARKLQLLLIVMLIVFVAAMVPLGLWVANTELSDVKISIVDPEQDEIVERIHVVRGVVDDPDSEVYVLIHPLKGGHIWVQNLPVVGPDGKWQSTCFFGTENLGMNERYEVVALATRENFLVNLLTGNNLRPGQTLSKLPKRVNKSKIVTVTREK